MRMLWELVSEALLESCYGTSSTPPSPTENSHIIMVKHSWLVGKSILTVPVCCLVLQMFVHEEAMLHGLNKAEEGLTLLPFSAVSVTFGTSWQGLSKSP